MKQEIIQGAGSITSLTGMVQKIRPQNILFVTGANSFSVSGAKDAVDNIRSSFDCSRFSDFSVNPQAADIERGRRFLQKRRCDLIVAIGGGSVLDTAKSLSVLACHEHSIDEYLKGTVKLSGRKIPLIALPTTAGTGSESTHFSAVYIGKNKYSLAHQSILPNQVILDSRLTHSLSPHLSASSGMDTICQAIESYWSVHSTVLSRQLAGRALAASLSAMTTVVCSPDEKSREDMLSASNLAGQAINITKTTAPHAVSYPITSYFSVPHGHAVALTLPSFIEFNSGVDTESLQDSRGVDFVQRRIREILEIVSVQTPRQACELLTGLMKDIHLAVHLTDLGIGRSDLDIIVRNGFHPERVKNNPRILTEPQLYFILENLLS